MPLRNWTLFSRLSFFRVNRISKRRVLWKGLYICVLIFLQPFPCQSIQPDDEEDSLYREYIVCQEVDPPTPKDDDDFFPRDRDPFDCDEQYPEEPRDEKNIRACACRGKGTMVIGREPLKKANVEVEFGRAKLLTLNEKSTKLQFSLPGHDGLDIRVLPVDENCHQALLSIYLHGSYIKSVRLTSRYMHIKMPQLASEYTVVLDQPVFNSGKACQSMIRVDKSYTDASAEHHQLVTRFSQLDLWQELSYDHLKVSKIYPIADGDGFIDTIQDACKRLDLYHNENSVSDILKGADRRSFSGLGLLYGIQFKEIPAGSTPLWSFPPTDSEENRYRERISFAWFKRNLNRYYDRYKLRERKAFWKLCEDWREKQAFSNFLNSIYSINTFLYVRSLGGSGGMDYLSMKVLLRNTVADILQTLPNQILIISQEPESNCSGESFMAIDGEMKGHRICNHSTGTYYGIFERNAESPSFVSTTSKDWRFDNSILENSLTMLLGESAEFNWKIRLPKFVRVIARGFKRKVVPTAGFWEKIDLTIVFSEREKDFQISMILDGYIAPATAEPPPDKNYIRPISEEYPSALSNFLEHLQTVLNLDQSTTSVISE